MNTISTQMSADDILARVRGQATADPIQIPPAASIFQHDPAPTISRAEAVKIAVEAALADDAIAASILARIGWDTIDRLRPKPTPSPLEIGRMIACELSIFDNGSGSSKGKHKNRTFLRYGAAINAYYLGAKGISKPSWRATAQLRDIDRVKHDIKRRGSANNRKVNISDDHAFWLEHGIIPLAEKEDALIGMLCLQSGAVGRHYFDRQAVLVPRSLLVTGQGTLMVISQAGGNSDAIGLSKFVTTQSNGAQLGGKAILTTRAAASGVTAARFAGWRIDDLKV